jgi:transposase
MTREEALRILELPRAQAEAALLGLWEKAEQWERLQTKGPSAEGPVTPTTPSGMTPVYLKPRARRSHKPPGRKKGHAGAWRRAPVRIDAKHEHRLTRCPECEGPVGPPIRTHRRIIEDLPEIIPEITEHTVHGHWCRRCKQIVTPKVSAALPGATLGLRFIVYTAWLHYCLGMSVGNCVKNAAVAHAFGVSPGGLTLAWKRLAGLLEGAYEEIGQAIRESAVLHADETGWRINGVTFWLWAFATKEYCYYLIDRHRGAGVVKQILGTLFPGVLITDFLGAYNAIEALAKQRCYFHLFTELIKVDKHNRTPSWKRFRKTLARLLKDSIRLGERRHELGDPDTYARRKAKLHQRLDALIDSFFDDADAQRLLKRLRRHRQEMLTFLDYDQVSPYNNHAEQQMRPAVITRKISQQNRSADGAKAHAILMSLFRSAQLQGLNPVEHVLQLAHTTLEAKPTPASASEDFKKAA